eukprot:Clim_evm25s147 gene=Clim_evmTU25s147
MAPSDEPQVERYITAFTKLNRGKLPATVQFFDRGDLYTAHGDDAGFVSREFLKTAHAVKTMTDGSGRQTLEYVQLNRALFESACRELLLVRCRRVEVFSYENGSWRVAMSASPGNVTDMEDILFAHSNISSAPVVCSLKLTTSSKQTNVGICIVDSTDYTLKISEFSDSELFANLESLLIQMSVKEVILCVDDAQQIAVAKQVIERCGAMCTERNRAEFMTRDVEHDLQRLVKKEAAGEITRMSSMPHASAATAGMLAFLALLGDSSNFGQYNIQNVNLKQYMRLDTSAVKALHLAPTGGQRGVNKQTTLYNLLNHTRTPMGNRRLQQWISQPLMDATRIEERLNLVEAFLQDIESRQVLQDEFLKRMPDLSQVAKKFKRKKGSLQDCVRIYQAIRRLGDFAQILEEHDSAWSGLVHALYVQPLKVLVEDFAKYQELIETTIDLDEASHGEFVIKASYDERLADLQNRKDNVKDEMNEVHRKTARDLRLEAGKTLKFETNDMFGHFFRITRKDESAIRGKKQYHVLQTLKDGVKFTTAGLKQLNEEYEGLTASYNKIQSGIANEVIAVTMGYFDPMLQLNDLLATLDVIFSFAETTHRSPSGYVRPVVHGAEHKKILKLQGARHPCLEVQPDINYIANDLVMHEDDTEMIIITGPNMGGKSTYIRMAGLICVMAQIGCFVPCEKAEISLVDCILCRVGAGDSQLRGISTFMAEMLESATILRSATDRSLIIIDELGRGTSTYDGFGLAWAIAEHLATEVKALSLFATHFHELTGLNQSVPIVKNRHVTAHVSDGQLTLLYKVKPGPSDESFGIQVAKLAAFPPEVVEAAQRKADELEDYEDVAMHRSAAAGNDADDTEVTSDSKKRKRDDGSSPTSAPHEDQQRRIQSKKKIRAFFKAVSALDETTMSADAARESIMQLWSKHDLTNDSYVGRLLKDPEWAHQFVPGGA